MPEVETETDPGVEEAPPMQINALVQLAQRQPLAALASLFLLGGTGGTLGSMYVAPLVDDALAAHEADDRAHDIDRIEDRIAAIEKQLEADGQTIEALKVGITRAVLILETR